MHLEGEQWRAFFDAFEREAFRFETQPRYTMPAEAESLARFLKGEPKPSGHNSRWHERVRGYRAAGKWVGRVRVVRQPLTDYQRYQFSWGIPGNVAAGEDIRILDLTEQDLELPTNQDWWLFDGARMVHLNYRSDGTQINRRVIEGDLAPYREWKRIVREASVSFADYVNGHR